MIAFDFYGVQKTLRKKDCTKILNNYLKSIHQVCFHCETRLKFIITLFQCAIINHHHFLNYASSHQKRLKWWKILHFNWLVFSLNKANLYKILLNLDRQSSISHHGVVSVELEGFLLIFLKTTNLNYFKRSWITHMCSNLSLVIVKNSFFSHSTQEWLDQGEILKI